MSLDAFALPEWLRGAIHWSSDALWTVLLPALLLATGLFLTVRLRFFQVHRFGEGLRTLVPRAQEGVGGVLSPFQAFMTALAATIGTGNIVGVATAVASGGPGALFWIWCYGFFAMAIKFTEAVLGITYRRMEGDRVSAGPMHYLSRGIGAPWLGWVYALVAGIAALFTTPFTQPNSIAVVWNNVFGLKTWITGVGLAVLTWLVVIGGIRSIGRAAEKLSPLKVSLYLGGGLFVIATHLTALPSVLGLVFREAFSLRAGLGAVSGVSLMMAMRYGLARGAYANEAGYGTAAVAYGTARSRDPRQQGLNAMMEVFIVSFVTSTISGLTILLTGVWQTKLSGPAMVPQAFNASMPMVGGWIVAVCVFLFGYTTLIGWAYYGEQFLEHVFGRRVVVPYRWLYCLLIVGGAVGKVETVWAWGDLLNGLQIFPNLVGIIGLSGVAAAVLRGERPPEAADGRTPA
jgi:AGCS family alanine or glycine:cation symporter